MMKSIYITILVLFNISVVSATVLGDCADGGGTVCNDNTLTTVAFDPTVDVGQQCRVACIDQASSITNFMNSAHANGGNWVCTATASSVGTPAVTTDPHGNQRLHCECSITCVKGIVEIMEAEPKPLGSDY